MINPPQAAILGGRRRDRGRPTTGASCGSPSAVTTASLTGAEGAEFLARLRGPPAVPEDPLDRGTEHEEYR